MSQIPGLDEGPQQANCVPNCDDKNDLIPTTNNLSSESGANKLPVKWNDDIFSLHTLEECKVNFEEYCEKRINHHIESKDKLSILRSCLELLNRLEGTRYNLLAGRVLIFLARVLPFFDQSGLNKLLEFDTRDLPQSVQTNLIKISERQTEKLKTFAQYTDQEIEEGETLSDDDDQNDDTLPSITAHLADPDKLYERFWKVQKLLNQPNQLYDKTNWVAFRTMVDSLILHFETIPSTCRVWKLSSSYMTEPKAFSLQMNDVNMRRCFILQIMIILQYLDATVDLRPENLQLDKLQSMWIGATTTRCINILQELPTKRDGHHFLNLVLQIFKNEELWNQWKNEKCREPKKPIDDEDDIVNMGSTYHKRRKLSDELRAAKPYNMHVIGSPDMTRLWNRKPQPLVNIPDVARYFSMHPEKQQERFKDPNISFRMLRLLRKNSHFFVPAAAVITPIEGYLKALADKHFNNSNAGSTQPSSKLATPSATPAPTPAPTPNSNSAESTPNDTNSREVTQQPSNITTAIPSTIMP